MLLSYTFSNFHSFADAAGVSFTLTERDKVDGWVRRSKSSARVSTAMGVFGANAAGKTSLVKVLPFLRWFVQDSFSLKPADPIQFMPHQARMNEESTFSVEMDTPDGIHRYELRAFPNRVLWEALYIKSSEPGSRFRYVFEREWNGESYTVRQQDFGLAESEASKVRQNCSLIAWGKQYNASGAARLANVAIYSNVSMHGRASSTAADLWEAAEFFSKNELQRQLVSDCLKRWDLGLSDVRLISWEERDSGSPSQTKTRWYPMGHHRSGDRDFELPFAFESSGTQSAYVLLWKLLPALTSGGIVFIDELEADLHPHMMEPILRLFHDEDTNPHDAQIIFTCHSSQVLDLLGRQQVMFVEKKDCVSNAYRGDDIEGLTNAHNLRAKYEVGALGAVPRL